jgi:hypothetical protein
MTTQGRVWVAGLSLCFSASLAWAQLYSGSVVGVVTDPSSAVIPGTVVSLVDEGKGFKFSAQTDSSGRYLIRGVPPGTYDVSATSQGFQSQTRSGVKIDVNQNVTVDFSLQLSSSSQAVTVQAETAELSTVDAVTGQVLDRKFINDLPNINRSVMDLTYLTPGIVSARNGYHSGDVNFVANGSRNATSDVLIDGTSVTNYEQNSGTLVAAYTPSPDAVEEFKVQTSNFSAEFGFSSSTVINMVTRSGTNQLHGSAYDYLRNQVLDANNFFANSAGDPLPGLRRNNFGGTFGGPIKKNKTFFFVDYDGTREVTQSTGATAVPTALERTGDFRELCGYQGGTFDSSGRCSSDPGQLWDPYVAGYDPDLGGAVRTQFIPFNNMTTYMSPGNPNLDGTGYQVAQRPGNLIDPVSYKLMQYFPLPNFNVGTDSYDPTLNWRGSGPNTASNDQYDIKVDHRFSDKSALSAKWSQQFSNSHGWNQYGNIADPNTSGTSPGHAYAFAINQTYTFTPKLLLSLSYGWTRQWGLTQGIISDYPDLDPVKLLGLPEYMNLSGVKALPNIVIGDSYGSQLGGQPWSYYLSGIDTHQFQGTLSWIKGSHEFKFGAEGRVHRINSANPGPTGGQFNYDLSTTSQNPNYDETSGGDAFASFMTGFGTPNTGGEYEVANWVSTQNFQYSAYFQDNWKVSRKLTVNLGLRYDVSLPRTERYDRMEWVDPDVVSPLKVPGLGTLHGGEIFAGPNDRTVYDIDATNFQPRIGFAWQPLSKTVIRGGYGIFYSTTKAGAAGPGAWGYQGYVKDTPWITTYNNDGSTPWGRLADPWPVTGPSAPPGNTLGLLNDVGGYDAWGPVRGINKTPYEQTWSFGIQRELPWGMVLEGTYVGKKGTHLYFGNAGNLNTLGPWVEKLSKDQVGDLFTYVPNPFYGIITDSNAPLSAPEVQAYQLQLPHPQFGLLGGDGPPYANSTYHAAQVRWEKRFSQGLQFLFTYVFSKSIDDSSATDGNIDWRGDAKGRLQNPNNYAAEKAISPYDSTHVFQFSHVYELPFGKGKPIGYDWNAVVNGFLGGWQFNGIWSVITGRPFTLGLNGGHSLPTYGGQGPNLIGTPEKASSDILDQYFANPEVFVKPDRYTISNGPRTVPWVRKPGQVNATLSLFKEFSLSKIHEGMRLQYRIEALNAFNHPQFSGPNTTVGSSRFGKISSQANSPREVQMALRLYF